jgi:selenocysteine lyase/cysteine desulfurase
MIKCQKDLFALDSGVTYLNCAYKAPLLKEAEIDAIEAIKRERNPFKLKADNYFEISNNIRKEFSKIIGSHYNEIAILPSTSYGFANVFNNIKLSGKHALVVENEFPSGYFAVRKWCSINNKELLISKRENLTASEWNQKIIKSINSSTNLVMMSSIHWMNGTKFDLEQIGIKCKEVGAYFIVDGTQSVGATSINVKELNIDALICAGYKWLFGPYSMALGYFSEKFQNGNPIEESWMNRSNAKDFSNLTKYDISYKSMAGRYNVGQTTNFILSPIMLRGLIQINKWGISNIEEYCDKLAKDLIKKLKPLDITFESENYFKPHLFSLGLPDKINPLNLKNRLDKENIYISLRGSNIRVSLNIFNDDQDIERLISVIKKELI